jgi:hypothetical protein
MGVLGALGREIGVELVKILDGIQRAREPRVIKGIEIDPIEAHARDPVEMLLPQVDWTNKPRKKIVDPAILFLRGLPLF